MEPLEGGRVTRSRSRTSMREAVTIKTLIRFKPQQGRMFNLPFYMDEKVIDVKSELHRYKGGAVCPPAESQLLVHRGAVLTDDQMLCYALRGAYHPIYIHWDEQTEVTWGGQWVSS